MKIWIYWSKLYFWINFICNVVLLKKKKKLLGWKKFSLWGLQQGFNICIVLYLAAHAYHMAKQSFHTAKPDRLVGRELEMETVNQFVRGHMTRKTAGSLYISGAPGTGKTAVLTHILDDVKVSLKFTQSCNRIDGVMVSVLVQ